MSLLLKCQHPDAKYKDTSYISTIKQEAVSVPYSQRSLGSSTVFSAQLAKLLLNRVVLLTQARSKFLPLTHFSTILTEVLE